MPKLPDIFDKRPIPRFGGSLQVPQVVESGTSQLGSAIVGFGEVLIQEQIKDDRYRVEDATTKLKQRMLELRKGDKGYIHTKSGDVGDKFFQDNMSLFDFAKNEISKELSESQTEMFGRRADLARVSFGENLINHITIEKNTFNGQIYKGGVEAELDIAASDFHNKNEVKQALLRTQKLGEAESDRLGLKGDARNILLKTNRSNIHEAVIRQAVDEDQYQYAKDWFEKYKKDILGVRHDEINSLLKESGIRAESQAAVDDYVLKGLDETEARAEARKLDPDTRAATLALISTRYGEANRIQDSEQKTAGERAWAILAESGIDAVPLSLLRTMDGKERIALEKVAADSLKGETIKTDPATYYMLRKMVSEEPIEFKEENLLKYTHLLSQSDLEEFIKLQTSDKGIVIARTKTQIMKQGARDIGISSSEIRQGFGDKLEVYYGRIDDELESFQINTGKKPTTKDISDIVDRLSIEVMRRPDWWAFQGARPAVKVEIEGVPSDLIDDLASAVREAGQPVSDENIKTLYFFMTGVAPDVPPAAPVAPVTPAAAPARHPAINPALEQFFAQRND